MESHPDMLFPQPSFSSSSDHSSLLPPSSSNAITAPIVFFPIQNTNSSTSNGLLGLEAATEAHHGTPHMQPFDGPESSGNKKGAKKVRRPRYSFQTRSHVDILDDGYRWRKYGQKAVKNHPFPRSYYRCTYQGCNVKKQIQRLLKDEGIVVTTYEGMHNHSTKKSNDNFEHILNKMQIYSSLK